MGFFGEILEKNQNEKGVTKIITKTTKKEVRKRLLRTSDPKPH